MRIFDNIQKAFSKWCFESFLKDNTTVEFKRSHGGQKISAQIRIFGWLVGEQEVLQLNKKGVL